MNEVNYTSLTHPQNKSGAMRFAYCTLLLWFLCCHIIWLAAQKRFPILKHRLQPGLPHGGGHFPH